MSLLRIFSGVGTLPGSMHANLMFEHVALLQILTFNAQKLGSHVSWYD